MSNLVIADVLCNEGAPNEQRTTDPGCMAEVAMTMQGHEDAEAFAIYAMGKLTPS